MSNGTITEPAYRVIKIGTPGPQGPAGPAGASGVHFDFKADEDIPANAAVTITGWDAGAGMATAQIAQPTPATLCDGVSEAAVLTGATSQARVAGPLQGQNTAAGTKGNPVYLAAGGAFSLTPPATGEVQIVGSVVTIDAVDGVIEVAPQPAVAVWGSILAFREGVRWLVGSSCVYSSQLYWCTEEHDSGAVFDPAKWLGIPGADPIFNTIRASTESEIQPAFCFVTQDDSGMGMAENDAPAMINEGEIMAYFQQINGNPGVLIGPPGSQIGLECPIGGQLIFRGITEDSFGAIEAGAFILRVPVGGSTYWSGIGCEGRLSIASDGYITFSASGTVLGSDDVGFRRRGPGIMRVWDGFAGENATLELLEVELGPKDATNRIKVITGEGSPEGVVTAPPGYLYVNRNGGAGATLWAKESGTGNTGWVAK